MKTLLCLRALPNGTETLAFGGMMAKLENTELVILTVVGEQEDARPVEAQLAQSVTNLRDQGLEKDMLSFKIRRGATVPQIMKELAENAYDLVIVGTQEAHRLWTAIFGTVTMRITETANVTVLVVRSVPPAIQRILVCAGGSRPRRKLIRVSRRLAEKTNATVHLLIVANPVPSMYTGLEAMDESLADLLQTETPLAQHLRWSADYMDRHGMPAELKVRRGAVADEILKEAQAGQYDLILIGAGPRNRLHRALAESVHHRLIDEASCSVLIVR